MFTEFLEPILPIDVVFDVVGLMLFNVALVLEDEVTARPPAVEVCGLVAVERAAGYAAVLGRPETLEALVDQRHVLLVEVLVGQDVGRAGVDLAAAALRVEAERVKG